MKFLPFGPFSIPLEVSEKSTALAKLFDEVSTDLNHAPGVYIFIDDKSGLPVYVGQAQRRSFGSRLADHFNKPHNSQLSEFLGASGTQASLLLLALATDNDVLRRANRTTIAHHQIIHRLEVLLIKDCLAVNQNLFNASSVNFFRYTRIPGYLNTVPQDMEKFPAADVLYKMLRRKDLGLKS